MKTIPTITTGKVLIAQPFMADTYFKRSVVLITENRKDGTVGFILNKSIGMNINKLIADFPDFESDVGFGGPMSTDTIHYIHRVGNLLEGSTEIANGVYWGGDFEKLIFLINKELIKKEDIKFFVGYSGWSKGQLNDELKKGSWLVENMHPNYAFKENQKKLWKSVLNNKGKVYTVIAQMDDFLALN